MSSVEYAAVDRASVDAQMKLDENEKGAYVYQHLQDAELMSNAVRFGDGIAASCFSSSRIDCAWARVYSATGHLFREFIPVLRAYLAALRVEFGPLDTVEQILFETKRYIEGLAVFGARRELTTVLGELEQSFVIEPTHNLDRGQFVALLESLFYCLPCKAPLDVIRSLEAYLGVKIDPMTLESFPCDDAKPREEQSVFSLEFWLGPRLQSFFEVYEAYHSEWRVLLQALGLFKTAIRVELPRDMTSSDIFGITPLSESARGTHSTKEATSSASGPLELPVAIFMAIERLSWRSGGNWPIQGHGILSTNGSQPSLGAIALSISPPPPKKTFSIKDLLKLVGTHVYRSFTKRLRSENEAMEGQENDENPKKRRKM